MLPEAIYLAAMGHHFERVTRQQIELYDFLSFLRVELELFEEAVPGRVSEDEIRSRGHASLERAEALYQSISDEFRYQEDGLDDALQSFRRAMAAWTDDLAHSAATA